MSAPLRLLGQLHRARGGTALVEFALVLPVLLMLYLAGTQLSDAISCNRKVTITTRAVADLASQNSSLTAAKVQAILDASSSIMTPYPVGTAMVRVSEISTTDYAGGYKVVWSRSNNGNLQPRPVNQTGTLPAAAGAIWAPNITLIFGEMSYPYAPLANFAYIHPMSLTQSVYMMPRKSTDIPCPDC